MPNPIALVTGASSGLGQEFARQLAQEPMDVVLVARRTDRLEKVRAELEKSAGIRCKVYGMDLSRFEAAEELHRETERSGFQVEWLVNNAGFGTSGKFLELPLEREREEIILNVYTLTALTRLYLPGMVQRKRGWIVNVGSIGSFVSTPYMATYAATKAFVLSFSEAVATELAGTDVRVMALCPGATKTEFQDVAGVTEAVPEMSYMTAEAVVRSAIAAAKAGKQAHVPGVMNKVLIQTTRVTPRKMMAKIVGSMFAPKTA